jgi:molybdopterin-containing oxidoreductase family molybdopterin binding subunit
LKYYIENPTPRNDFGQEIADFERHPYYTHANESYMENPLRKKYPLMGCSEHNKYHVHSQLAYTPVMRELEPEPMIKINASDAAERGISQGDVVKAYNDHGYVHIKALVTEGIKPGVISIPHGFQAEQFIEGHSQDLTNVYMNDFCSNSAFYDFLCEVEKI